MSAVIQQWRPIPEWEELYEVSDLGRVKSCAGGIRQVDLATRFGIAQTQVSRILRNESWAS